MTNIGIVGCGRRGLHHLRLFYSLPNCEVGLVADRNPARFAAVDPGYPTVVFTCDNDLVLENPAIDAVVIATPPSTHYDLVRKALLFDKDVLCEKPLTMRSDAAGELYAIARERGLVLMVGHVFLYDNAIRKLKECISFGECGRVLYLQSTRTDLGPFRLDANVVWELAVHDVSIFSHLLDAAPLFCSARGGACLRNDMEDFAFITLVYPGNVTANSHVSWISPQRERRMTVVGDRRMLVWDELNTLEPVRIFDKGFQTRPAHDNHGEIELVPRRGEIIAPAIDPAEPLSTQAGDFLSCIAKRREPLTGGKDATQTVAVLEAINRSMQGGGVPVEIGASSGAARTPATPIAATAVPDQSCVLNN